MGNDYSKALSASRMVTLNGLKDQLYSLNMRLLLAIQCHNEQAQKEIRTQIAEIQAEIDQMSLGSRGQRSLRQC